MDRALPWTWPEPFFRMEKRSRGRKKGAAEESEGDELEGDELEGDEDGAGES